MHKLDSSFKQSKQDRQGRKRARLFRQVGAVAVLLLATGLGSFFYMTYDQWSFEALDEELVRVEVPESEELADVPEIATYVPAIVNLAGDPLVISIGGQGGTASKTRAVERPPALAVENIAPVVTFLDDTMISSSKRFMTTLPSSQEDFMFFQSQRTLPRSSSVPVLPASLPENEAPSLGDGVAISDESAGWGETLGGDEQKITDFEKTRVENTTSVAFMKKEEERSKSTEEIFVKVLHSRSLFGLLIENRFDKDDADKATKLAEELFRHEGTAVRLCCRNACHQRKQCSTCTAHRSVVDLQRRRLFGYACAQR